MKLLLILIQIDLVLMKLKEILSNGVFIAYYVNTLEKRVINKTDLQISCIERMYLYRLGIEQQYLAGQLEFQHDPTVIS